MIIHNIVITDILQARKSYSLSDRVNLITSEKNSQGKTTLLRFILHGLGYAVPATKGIHSFTNYRTSIDFKESYISNIKRSGDICTVKFADGGTAEYVMPDEQNKLQGLLFSTDSDLILHNLLAVFYIDQEKGWTMLNRGKIIGNNRFNVEDYISGVTRQKHDTLKYEIDQLTFEIKKLTNLLTIADFQEESLGNENMIADKSTTELTKNLAKAEYSAAQKRRELSNIKKMRSNSNALVDIIEKNKLFVKYNNEVVPVNRKNIVNFTDNDEYLKRLELQAKHDMNDYQGEADRIRYELEKRRTLFNSESVLKEMELRAANVCVDRALVEGNLKALKYRRAALSKMRKEKLIKEPCMTKLYSLIIRYSDFLGIRKYIHNEKEDFVLTHDLKGYSGTILAQLSLVFKLAYIQVLKGECKIVMPIIIDSPRTTEMTEEASSRMMELIQEFFSDHQVIVASVYDILLPNINRIVLTGQIVSD